MLDYFTKYIAVHLLECPQSIFSIKLKCRHLGKYQAITVNMDSLDSNTDIRSFSMDTIIEEMDALIGDINVLNEEINALEVSKNTTAGKNTTATTKNVISLVKFAIEHTQIFEGALLVKIHPHDVKALLGTCWCIRGPFRATLATRICSIIDLRDPLDTFINGGYYSKYWLAKMHGPDKILEAIIKHKYIDRRPDVGQIIQAFEFMRPGYIERKEYRDLPNVAYSGFAPDIFIAAMESDYVLDGRDPVTACEALDEDIIQMRTQICLQKIGGPSSGIMIVGSSLYFKKLRFLEYINQYLKRPNKRIILGIERQRSIIEFSGRLYD